MKGKQVKRVQVAIRMRPLLTLFEDEQAWLVNSSLNKISSIPQQQILKNITNFSETTMKKKNAVESSNFYEFSCDYAFDKTSTNAQIYNESCDEIVNQFCSKENRINGTIFMYGQTTSGKTYTMLGDNDCQGIISYSLKNIFKNVQNKSQISVSYFQIYNEQINDLLNPGSTNLKLIDDMVQGAKQYNVHSFQVGLKLLQFGQNQRAYRSKKYHDHSSRSHTIFQIKKYEENSKNPIILNLVDLAGSQRLTDEEGGQETGYINKSLFILSTVISRLATGKKNVPIPFRDSKLTKLLAPSLLGNSKTLVICTISPATLNFYQTLSTLRFAACSRKVQLKANETQSPKYNKDTIIKLQEENLQLKAKLQKLKNTESQFLENKSKKIMEMLKRQNLGNCQEWKQKLDMLCREYRNNVETLQKQYTKAMINAVAQGSNLNKSSLLRLLQDSTQ